MTRNPNETRREILKALQQVQDPELKRDIVSLGFVRELKINGGSVCFDLELTPAAQPIEDQLKTECRDRLLAIEGVEDVTVNLTAQTASSQSDSRPVLQDVKNVVAIASGKGGVGKSTVAANVALALAQRGARVGLLDCDIYGPSMPLMFNLAGQQPEMIDQQTIKPIDQYGVKLMSMGFLSSDDKPVIWRGPMVHNVIQQFLHNVAWGELDYMVIDMPPGTGDAQLSLSQQSALTGSVIVTTPQDVSLIDARKGLKMFEQVNVPVLGIVENMSYFECDGCGKRTAIFKRGGGEKTSEQLGVPFLGSVPIDPRIVLGGDAGEPVVAGYPDSPAAQMFVEIARNIARQLQISGFDSPLAKDLSLTWK